LIKHRLAQLVAEAVAAAQAAGTLPAVTLPPSTIEHPQNAEHGDYAANLPMKLARAMGRSPLEIAADIVAAIPPSPEIDTIEVAKPGFINFKLNRDWIKAQVDAVLAAGDSYGNVDSGQGQSVQIEFVSVNPTGPLHVGHARGAVLGSGLANLLAAAGYQVQKEYYVNDAGNQIDLFRRSLYARYLQALGRDAEMPEDGYQGDYLVAAGQDFAKEIGDRYADAEATVALKELGDLGLERMVAEIGADLSLIGVDFDLWFREHDLFVSGEYDTTMKLLRDGGYIADKEGATWFTSTALGEEKDNVVVRGDGTPTYFASDIAYHRNKLVTRAFDRVINIWGADHHGHVSRMKAVLTALGLDPARLTVIVCQMVTLRRGTEVVRISKRSGDIITLKELVDEVGADACRYFFLARSADSQMDFDLELAKKESPENPVYYVQYAHARISSIRRLAEEKGVDFTAGDVSLLGDEAEIGLIRQMLMLPEVIDLASQTLQPHHIAYYAQDLATAFHHFYDNCRVVTDDIALSRARLKLVVASQTVLRRSLSLMGMAAPEKM
jgi:arginyl-tRNA synthetase